MRVIHLALVRGEPTNSVEITTREFTTMAKATKKAAKKPAKKAAKKPAAKKKAAKK